MLAKRRSILLNGKEIERTPLLVPSFSSKGFPYVEKILKYCSELIDGPMLVSAYDLHYRKFEPPFHFPSLIFVDSGGYEASKDTELSDLGDKEHTPRSWTKEMHQAQLAQWHSAVPSVFISYDHPRERLPIKMQIERARDLIPERSDFVRELLLKPEREDNSTLPIPEIIKNIHALSEFDVIGVTEKEIGNCILSRMKHIAQLREALDRAGLDTPIHVFGSMDTITTPMYFLSGADIFDGLTWLRFAYHEGCTIYKHNYGALKFSFATKAHMIDGHCWNDNYRYMREMELEMRRFLNGNDFSSFKYNGDLFRRALDSALEAIGGQDGRR